jgi:hypothetical protein
MLNTQSIASAVVLLVLLTVGSAAHGEETWHEDLRPCTGSGAEPSRSGVWDVAFCNRTGHDLVIEMHENECPANNWAKRGDVYRKSLRRDESVTIPLCYANEPSAAGSVKPGVPMLRIPGGKGVVTTWTISGDCGDRSDRLNRDAQSFYDRGDYKTGIILLQYPSGASHCVGEAPAAASVRPKEPSAIETPHAAAATAPVVAPAAPPVAPPVTPTAPLAARTGQQPSLSAAVDAKDAIGRTVRVFAANAKSEPNYKCSFTLEMTFSDGATWSDRVQATVPGSDDPKTLVWTHKFLKSVSKVVLNPGSCTAL